MTIFLSVILAALGEWWYGSFSLTPTHEQLARFVSATLGLNIIHGFFTFAMVAAVPELKAWTYKSTNGRPRTLWLNAGAIFLSTFIIVILLNRVFPVPAWTLSMLATVFIFFPIHHGIAQHLGLGLASVMSHYRNDLDRRTVQRLSAETRLKNSLFLAFAVYALTIKFSSETENLWLSLHSISLFSIRILIAAIIVNSLLLPKPVRLSKLRFTLRLLLYVFPLQSFALYFGGNFIHGYEYLGVTEQIMTNSSMRKQERWTFLKILLLLSTLGFALLLFKRPEGLIALAWGVPYNKLPLTFKVLGAVSMGLSFSHYYFDAMMFRMKDPITRAIVSPLLTGGSSHPVPIQIDPRRLRREAPTSPFGTPPQPLLRDVSR